MRSSPSEACAADQPLVGLVEVGHRVRVGALDAVLAAHDVVEAERRVVAGEPDADHRPAGAQQLEPERARGLRADRVEHEVRLAGVARLLGRAVDGWAPSAERPRAPLVLRLDDGDVRGCPSSSAAWSVTSPIVPAPITTALSTPVRRQPHRVDAVGQRLHQRADARGDAVGQHPRVGRAAPCTKSANAPGDVDADQHAVAAQVRVAGAAQPALAAAARAG